jgi:hypothetical protein
LGGGAIVVPGVTIGTNTVVGARGAGLGGGARLSRAESRVRVTRAPPG